MTAGGNWIGLAAPIASALVRITQAGYSPDAARAEDPGLLVNGRHTQPILMENDSSTTRSPPANRSFATARPRRGMRESSMGGEGGDKWGTCRGKCLIPNVIPEQERVSA
jgi:hypothetical protein